MHFCIWCARSQVCMLGCGLCTRSSAFELSPTMAAQTQRYRSKSSQSMCSLPVLCPCSSVLFMSSPAHTSARALLSHDFLPISLSPLAPPYMRGLIAAQNRSLCFLPLRGSRFCLPPSWFSEVCAFRTEMLRTRAGFSYVGVRIVLRNAAGQGGPKMRARKWLPVLPPKGAHRLYAKLVLPMMALASDMVDRWTQFWHVFG